MAPHTSPEHHPAFEEYCETIFELEEDGLKVIQARIAERLQISRPAVSEMVRRLSNEGYIEKQQGQLKLTKTGRDVANRVVRRHRLAERFLTDVLKLSWSEAHHEAGKWEHIISDSVESAMSRLLGEPTTCPHGNPIPGSGYVEPDTEVLSTVEAGEAVTISRIPEELEFVPGMLEFLESHRLLPGTVATIKSVAPNGPIILDVDGSVVEVDGRTADRVLVMTDD